MLLISWLYIGGSNDTLLGFASFARAAHTTQGNISLARSPVYKGIEQSGAEGVCWAHKGIGLGNNQIGEMRKTGRGEMAWSFHAF